MTLFVTGAPRAGGVRRHLDESRNSGIDIVLEVIVNYLLLNGIHGSLLGANGLGAVC